MFYYLATFFNVLFYVLEFVFPDQLSRLRRLLPETAVGHFYSPFVPQVVVVVVVVVEVVLVVVVVEVAVVVVVEVVVAKRFQNII